MQQDIFGSTELRAAIASAKDAQMAIAAWWIDMGTSRQKAGLVSELAIELGVDLKPSTVKAHAAALAKLSEIRADIIGDTRQISLSSWHKILSGVKAPAEIERLVKIAIGGATVKECVAAKPKKTKKFKADPLARAAHFLVSLCRSCPDLSRLVAGMNLAIAVQEYEDLCPTVAENDDLPPGRTQLDLFGDGEELPAPEAAIVRPDAVSSEDWDKFSKYEQRQAIALLRGETVVCAMFNFNKPYTPFIYWAKAAAGVVKIDRTNKTYGNPYRVGNDGTLPEVVEKYERKVKADPALLNRIPIELRGKALACWCKKGDGSAQCHGDVLAAIANNSGEK